MPKYRPRVWLFLEGDVGHVMRPMGEFSFETNQEYFEGLIKILELEISKMAQFVIDTEDAPAP